jgi:NAD(P)-dependent dehydrogenase (short-subunit alcohol dehydrogenase family)
VTLNSSGVVSFNLDAEFETTLDFGRLTGNLKLETERTMEVILVTGANRGIGLALSRVLLATGKVVIAGSRRPGESSELNQLILSYPETLDLIQCDVNSEQQLAAAAEASLKHRKKLDVIVNNAGIMPEAGHESILDIDLALFWPAFDTNVLGAARVIRAFYPLLAQSERPRIVNVSSGLGSISTREGIDYYAYSASKAALNMLTRTIANELAPRGVTTVAISPGWVRTEMGGEQATLSPEESAQSLAEAIQKIGPELNGEFLDRNGQTGRYFW